MNDVDIKALLGNRAVLWQEEAACGGDVRFTLAFESLTLTDLGQMRAVCKSCPVRAQCARLAADTNAVEVFMAGEYRHEPIQATDPDGFPYEATTLDNPS